jgi:hypothetical protein
MDAVPLFMDAVPLFMDAVPLSIDADLLTPNPKPQTLKPADGRAFP